MQRYIVGFTQSLSEGGNIVPADSSFLLWETHGYINQETWLSAKHQGKGAAPKALMLCGIVGMHQRGNMALPVCLLLYW